MSNAGKDAKCYMNTGTHASPVLVEMKRVVDLTLPLSKGEVESKRRESKWKRSLGGLKELGLQFGYEYKRGTDAVYTKLMDSLLNDTPVEFYVLDQANTVTGARGWRAYMQVFSFEKKEEMENVQMYDADLKLTDYEEGGALIEPDEYTVP